MFLLKRRNFHSKLIQRISEILSDSPIFYFTDYLQKKPWKKCYKLICQISNISDLWKIIFTSLRYIYVMNKLGCQPLPLNRILNYLIFFRRQVVWWKTFFPTVWFLNVIIPFSSFSVKEPIPIILHKATVSCIFRSSRSQMGFKISVLKNLQNSQENTCARVSFLTKL